MFVQNSRSMQTKLTRVESQKLGKLQINCDNVHISMGKTCSITTSEEIIPEQA